MQYVFRQQIIYFLLLEAELFLSLSRQLLIVLLLVLVSSCSTYSVQVTNHAEGQHFKRDQAVNPYNCSTQNDVLKIMTLNIAHGRKEAFNQIFVSAETIKQNLSDIAKVLSEQCADVVALQEADGPSGWSGNFDHIELIAKQAGYPWHYRADHAQSWLFSYGTAVLSRWPISETIEHTFTPSPPTLNKGFLLSKVTWKAATKNQQQIVLDVVSVHLDFSRKKVRKRQITEIAEVLNKRNNPMIVLGDFNSDWFAEESVVKQLTQKTKMKAYKPHADNLHTYAKRATRLDWILISDELEFTSYQVIPDVISDHLAVVAEVKLVN